MALKNERVRRKTEERQESDSDDTYIDRKNGEAKEYTSELDVLKEIRKFKAKYKDGNDVDCEINTKGTKRKIPNEEPTKSKKFD